MTKNSVWDMQDMPDKRPVPRPLIVHFADTHTGADVPCQNIIGAHQPAPYAFYTIEQLGIASDKVEIETDAFINIRE